MRGGGIARAARAESRNLSVVARPLLARSLPLLAGPRVPSSLMCRPDSEEYPEILAAASAAVVADDQFAAKLSSSYQLAVAVAEGGEAEADEPARCEGADRRLVLAAALSLSEARRGRRRWRGQSVSRPLSQPRGPQ